MRLSVRTPVCDLLGIDVPILSVGFGASATPELAAAVSNAGGCGVLGLGIPLEHVRDRIRKTRELTDRPFGGNFIIASLGSPHATDEQRAGRRAGIEAAIAERIPVIVLFWGDPAPFVGPAHRNGVKVLIQVGSAEEAAAAARAGVDAVIIQGTEAGGHNRATRSIWDVLPDAVAAAAPTPVLASGGVGDGAGLARVLRLGGQGVSLGTRFVASEEAWIHPDYKRRVVAASASDTSLTPDLYDIGWRDAPHRTLKNKTFAEWDAAGRPAPGSRPHEGETIGTSHLPWGDLVVKRYTSAMIDRTFDGNIEYASLWAGESVDVVKDIKPAAEIVRELVREAEAALA